MRINEIEIESGIPMQKGGYVAHSGWTKLVEKMEIGDSFIMPLGADEMGPLNALVAMDRFGECGQDLTGVQRFWRTA